MKGMILAAGFGTRMLPITRFIPKALLPVGARPLLEWNLLHLAACGVDDVVVNAHHLAADMRQWAAARAARGNAPLPRVRLVVERRILGTGGGIANAAHWLDSDPVVVVNADQLFRPDLAAVRRAHEAGRFLATLVCVRDPRHAQIRTEGARVVEIEARPVFGDPGLLTFTGLYLLAHAAVDALVLAVGGEDPPGSPQGPGSDVGPVRIVSTDPRAAAPDDSGSPRLGGGTQFLDVVTHFRRWMAEGRLGVHLVEDEPFLEAGTPEAYLELLREAASVLPESRSPRVHHFGFVTDGARIAADAWIEESAVLDGAVVAPGARVVRSILGPGATANGEVARSIVAHGESRPIRLLPRSEEDALRRTLAGLDPELAGPDTSIRLLQGDGSTRRIARVVRRAQSRIAVLPALPDPEAASVYPCREGDDVPDEPATFAYVAGHLERLGVPVARVYALDAASRVLLLEDLGDTDLYGLVRAARRAEAEPDPDGPAACSRRGLSTCRDAYEEALDILHRMQAPPPVPFDPGRTRNPDYDEPFILRFEADYFRREMVRGHCGLELTDAAGVEADAARAAGDAVGGAPRVFMHRDYQSRNLMCTPRGLVVIDFQGARLGPPEYDLAALVLDPYADLPSLLRSELVERFLDRTTRTAEERRTARTRYRACGVNRMQQALGAFGYLGGRLGRPGFLEHAPAAAARLRELAAGAYPKLEALADRVIHALAEKP